MSDIPPWLYTIYRANLHRNHHRPHKPARVERPYMWMLWGAHGIAYTLRRAQQWREYQTKTTQTLEPPTCGFLTPEKEDT